MNLLTIIAMIGVVAVITALFWGSSSMAHGGSYEEELNDKHMLSHVALQAAVFVVLLLSILLGLF